jgi:putative transposase
MPRIRRRFDGKFKARVALEAIRGLRTISEISKQFKVHPNQVTLWKKQLLDGADAVFEVGSSSSKKDSDEPEAGELYEQIGRMKVELEWLKKKLPRTREAALRWIEPGHESLSVRRQCQLLNIHRSQLYYEPVPESKENLEQMRLLDEQHLKTPFWGSRNMAVFLSKRTGQAVNRKKTQRLMRLMGLEGLAPGPSTTKRHPGHKVYLLRDVIVDRPNQVWCSDITYVPLHRGFLYLVAVMDWYSRHVLSWRLSNSMDVEFCVEALDAAFEFGTPEIFNTDQGVQFTSRAFTDRLLSRAVEISMDGRGRALDNVFIERLWRTVKYEDVYLKGYDSGADCHKGLTSYFTFYSHERPHQSLDYRTPWEVHSSRS